MFRRRIVRARERASALITARLHGENFGIILDYSNLRSLLSARAPIQIYAKIWQRESLLLLICINLTTAIFFRTVELSYIRSTWRFKIFVLLPFFSAINNYRRIVTCPWNKCRCFVDSKTKLDRHGARCEIKNDLIISNDEMARLIRKAHRETITTLMRRTKTTKVNERCRV